MTHRANIKELPVWLIKVKLPIEVKIETKTWTHFYNKLSNDNFIFLMVFVSKEDNYTASKQHKVVTFCE